MKRKEEREEGRELILADGRTVHFQIEFFAWKTPGTQTNTGGGVTKGFVRFGLENARKAIRVVLS